MYVMIADGVKFASNACDLHATEPILVHVYTCTRNVGVQLYMYVKPSLATSTCAMYMYVYR